MYSSTAAETGSLMRDRCLKLKRSVHHSAARAVCIMVRTSSNLVSMSSNLSWRYDRVNASRLDDPTGHAPEGKRWPCQGAHEDGEGRKVFGIHVNEWMC